MSNEYRNIDDLMDLATELNQEEIQTMMDVRTVYRKRKMQPVDVEERLRRFHEAHDHEKGIETHDHEKRKGAALRTYIYYALAAAAVFIGALLLLHKPAIDTQTEGTVFVADHEQSGISLTNEQGEQVMLSKATKQNSSISLECHSANPPTLPCPMAASSIYTRAQNWRSPLRSRVTSVWSCSTERHILR